MDFTLPVMKFNAEQTPENSGPRYRPMRRKRIEAKQEQTPQNIKNERRRQRFRELMNLNSSSQSGSTSGGTSGVEKFAHSPQREQNNESTVSRGSVRLFDTTDDSSVVNSSVEGNQEPCSFDLLESQPEMPYSTQDRINQNQVTESQASPRTPFEVKKRSRHSTTRLNLDDSITPSMTSSPVIKRIRTEAMSMSPARSPGWGSPKSMNETNDDFSDDSFFEQAAQQIIEQQRIATQKTNDDKEAITKNQSPKDDPMTSQTDMMTQPSQRIICEASDDDEFDESLDPEYLSQIIKS